MKDQHSNNTSINNRIKTIAIKCSNESEFRTLRDRIYSSKTINTCLTALFSFNIALFQVSY